MVKDLITKALSNRTYYNETLFFSAFLNLIQTVYSYVVLIPGLFVCCSLIYWARFKMWVIVNQE